MRRALFGTVALLLSVPSLAGASLPGDPLLGEQWALAAIDMREAWKVTTGGGAVIAVLDSAVDVSHPDLHANIGPGVYDALARKRGPGSPAVDHGTYVAGIAAAAGGNGEGISGVAPDATILPVTVCEATCPAEAVARGIRYATRHGADVINLSLYVGLIDEGLEDVLGAAAAARERGVVVVAAAGNNSEPYCVEPAASVLCVGAVGPSDSRPLYTNGDVAMQSDYLVAPGGSDEGGCDTMVVSTVSPSPQRACPAGTHYAYSLGTSAAAPHVAGVAALLSSVGADASLIEDCILTSADDLGPPGRDPIFGYGRLNAAAAVECVAAAG